MASRTPSNATRLATAVILTVALAASTGALAQSARSSGGGGGNDARFQAMINQLNGEKANLEREKAKLETEIKSLKADLAKAESKADATAGRLQSANASAARLQRTNESAQLAIDRYKQREQELISEFRKTIDILRDTESEKTRLGGELAETRLEYRECARHNTEMFDIASDVLDAYENKGLFTRASQGEPFTKLARVRVQNIADEYRYALEDNQIDVDIFEDDDEDNLTP